MSKNLLLIILALITVACDSFSPRKIKNVRELTPLLATNSNEQFKVDAQIASPLNKTFTSKSYVIAPYKVIAAPVFAKGVLYSIDNKGYVTAFSVKEKKISWSQNIAGKALNKNFVGGGITYNNEKLFVTNGSRFLTILNAKTGHELTRKEFPDVIRNKPVLLSEKEAIIQTISNQAFNYNFDNANIIWQHEGVVETLASDKHIHPIIYNDKVIVSYTSGQIAALDIKTGEERWSINLSISQDVGLPNFDPSTIPCQPIIEKNDLYVASSTNKLLKLNASTGQMIWQVDASDIQSMSLNGNSIFATNNAKQIVAFSTRDGKIKWSSDLDLKKDRHKTKAASFSNPLILKNDHGWELSVITDRSEIYSFVAEGESLSTTPMITKIMKNAEYSGMTCCGNIYIIGGKNALFFEQKAAN